MPSSYRKKISDDQIRRSCLVQLTCYSDRCVDDLRSDAVFLCKPSDSFDHSSESMSPIELNLFWKLILMYRWKLKYGYWHPDEIELRDLVNFVAVAFGLQNHLQLHMVLESSVPEGDSFLIFRSAAVCVIRICLAPYRLVNHECRRYLSSLACTGTLSLCIDGNTSMVIGVQPQMCYSSEHHHDIEQVCHCKLLQVGFCGANLVDLAVMLMCGFSVQLFSQSVSSNLARALGLFPERIGCSNPLRSFTIKFKAERYQNAISSCEEVSERDHVYGVGVTKVDNRQEKTQEWT
ncbi:hypothetical protein E3N88_39145 [Mikania micrantha]|uniref:Uncharacterized protein n=1 Tax=Mikania micrantha TaxID=192012 RepID=A0A5N6LVZ6_9ASTR|nr:hypothetical protein E3N88_39145 [Mikania micrantha]